MQRDRASRRRSWTAEMSNALLTTAPASRSECPPRYLVQLSVTMSTPISSGLWFMGDARVLSMTVMAPRSCAAFATSG